jgi:hypothetical protein
MGALLVTSHKMALLEQRALLRLPGKETFVVAEAFKVGSKIGGRMLSAIGWNFSKQFLSVTEKNIPETRIAAWTLLYTASDKWILETLDGRPGTCALANIHSLVTLGEKAYNHLDGPSNFAYVRSPVDRRLWAVHWFVNSANEWIIGAVYVPHPESDWPAGSRLFASRNIGESVFKRKGRRPKAPPGISDADFRI